MDATQVLIPYEPRDTQLSVHEAMQSVRFVVCVAHRRLGKTVLAVNDLIRAAFTCALSRPRCYYIAPTLKQAKAVAWDYLLHYTNPIPGREVNISETRVDLPNGARIQLAGADNPDNLRGLYMDEAVLDETGMMEPRTWSEVVRPALADRIGRALFIGTPNGKNLFYDLKQQALATEDWKFLEFKASETKIIPVQELEAARSVMTADEYAQEFECSFEASVKGAIYGQEIAKAHEDKRVRDVPYDAMLRVDTWWDLGIGDAMAIWFSQSYGNEIRLIDYYENSGEGLQHYFNMLDRKGYAYGRHIAPHDIEVRELGSGKSRKEISQGMGINFEVAPRLGLEDGINAARMMFSRCYFDQTKTAQGLECLMNYRRDYNTRIAEFKPTPVHDWASHGADAFRVGAISHQNTVKPIKLVYPRMGII